MILLLYNTLLCYSQYTQSTKFNYPIVQYEVNFIYLNQYTLQQIKAPYYEIKSSNDFNLNIQQTILPLNQSIIYDDSIQCGSNQIYNQQISSNYFWIITNTYLLFQGFIKSNGEIDLNQIPFIIQYPCYSINLISVNYGILNCINQTNFIFQTINISNLELNTYQTNITILQDNIFNYNSKLIQNDNNSYSIGITYLTQQNAYYYLLKFEQNYVQTINEYILQGNFIQICISNNFDFLFYLEKDSIQITSISLDQIQILTFPGSNFIIFSIQELSQYLFRIVLLNNLIIETFIYDFKQNKTTEFKNSYVLNPYQYITYFQISNNQIIMITDNYISKFDLSNIIDDKFELSSSIKQSNYFYISSIQFSLYSESRNIFIIFQQYTNSIVIQTLYANQPQIKIPIDVTKNMFSTQTEYQLQIEISSQSLEQISIQIELYLQLVTKTSCPILYSHENDPLIIRYPDSMNIPFNHVYMGPNLTNQIQSNSTNLYTDTTSNFIKSQSKIPQSIFYVLCAKFQSEAIYCTQYKNKTIQITVWNPIISSNYFFIQSNSTLQQCKCYKTEIENYVLMQFTNQTLIQNFTFNGIPTNLITFNFQQQILNAAIFQNSLLIITADNYLTSYSLKNNGSTLIQITNQQFNQMYFNLEKYPYFVFIDNTTNLVIMYYAGQQYYEFVNTFSYPHTKYTSLTIGILNNGIYIAILEYNQSLLYYYQEQSIFIQGQNKTYFMIDLLGYSYYNSGIISSYTSLHFFVMLQNELGQYCAFFSGSGSSFVSFIFADFIVSNTSNYQIQQLSVILSYTYQLEEVQLFTNSNIAINGTVFFGKFQFVPYFQSNVIQYETSVVYNVSNLQCSNQLNQSIKILYDRSLVQSREYNSFLQNIQANNSSIISIFPEQLFFGNIQNYNISGPNNITLTYTVPITSPLMSLNFNFQATQFYNGIFYVQNNQSLYQILLDQSNFTKIYDFSSINPHCSILFVEILTQFPVSICFNITTMIYAYNNSTQQIISYNLSAYSNIYKGEYKNGILQLFTFIKKLSTQINYFTFYFWIANETINLVPIFNKNAICSNCYLQYVYYSLSNNFTTQPCQIFGISSTQQSGYYNPVFYILKTCMPSNISIAFGYQSNNYTEITNIYFSTIIWNLYQTLPIYFKFLSDIQQIGDSLFLFQDLVEIQFSVPLSYTTNIYNIQFNLSDGTILSFFKSETLYLAHDSQCGYYMIFQGPNKTIVSINCLSNNQTLIANVYASINSQSKQNKKEITQIVGQRNISVSFDGAFALMTNKYLLVTSTSSSNTYLYAIQNYIELNVNLTNISSAQLALNAYNNQSSSLQYLFLINQEFQEQEVEVITDSVNLILILTLTILFILLASIIIFLAYKKSKTLAKSQYLEMISANNQE